MTYVNNCDNCGIASDWIFPMTEEGKILCHKCLREYEQSRGATDGAIIPHL
jgi:predicted nucleic acid-binding Zn ribbon protein